MDEVIPKQSQRIQNFCQRCQRVHVAPRRDGDRHYVAKRGCPVLLPDEYQEKVDD